MPFKSMKQNNACWATHGFGGKVDCKEWAKKTDYKHLPEKKSKLKSYKEWSAELNDYCQYCDSPSLQKVNGKIYCQSCGKKQNDSKSYKESTMNKKFFIGNCINGLDDNEFCSKVANDATEMSQLDENGKQID